LGGFASSALSAALAVWAYYDEGSAATQIAFAVGSFTALILFATWFWGVFLAMSGRVSSQGIGYLVVHALTGSIPPLIYTVSLGLQLETLSSQPIDGFETSLDLCAPLLLTAQLLLGRSVRLRLS
jgi:hypothetical protein